MTVGERGPAGEMLALGGYPILNGNETSFVTSLLQAMARGERRQVFFANTNFVVQCQELRASLTAPGMCIVNDGIGMDLGALLVHGRRFAGNLNGTDLIPVLCRHSPRPLRFFLVGGRPGVAEAAARTLQQTLGQEVVGTCDGYAEFSAAGVSLAARINASGADVLLVALGNPLQERWIVQQAAHLQVPLAFGVGAMLDFLSGNARRAPVWVRRLRLEWSYRLLHEPRRLLKRYSWDLLVFFALCLRHRRRLNAAPPVQDSLNPS